MNKSSKVHQLARQMRFNRDMSRRAVPKVMLPGIRIPVTLEEAARKKCERDGLNLTTLVREALSAYVFNDVDEPMSPEETMRVRTIARVVAEETVRAAQAARVLDPAAERDFTSGNAAHPASTAPTGAAVDPKECAA